MKHAPGLSNRLVIALCLGAIVIGIVVLIGYALGSASIAALGTNGKPAAAVSALGFIVLGAGLLALRRAPLTGLLTPRRAALAVIVIASASLLSAALSWNNGEWQVWAARGGVYFHAYPITAVLLLALGSTLALATTRWDLAGHVIASAVLLTCIVFVFGYVLHVPSFFDPLGHLAPVAVTTSGLALLAAAAVLVRPRGWVVALLSRTSAGAMSRLLLPAIFVVPLYSIAINHWLTDHLGHTPHMGLTAVVAVNVFFGAAILLGAGAALHRRESDRLRLAAIVESSDDAIIGTSSAGLIESWNGGAQRMYGYTAGEVLGRSVAMIAPPEAQHEAPRLLERLGRGERIEPFETVRVAKDGRLVEVLLSVSAALDDAGNVVGASSIAHDITDRKKAEDARVESEARYRTLVENLPQKILLKNRHSVYVSANEAYVRDLGVDPEAVAGKTDYDFFPGDLAEKYRADDARIMGAGVAEDLEEEYVERGQRRFIHTVKTPLKDPQGTVTSILVILWDITEKKLAEERLANAMAELERFNRDLAKSEAALKEAQRVAKIGHWEASMVTGAVTWSDEHHRILGIPIGSVTPSHELLLSMMDPKSRRRQVEAVARSLAASGNADAEDEIDVRVTTPAGASLVLSQRVFVDRDDAGKVVGVHGTLQDITQRVATQQALRDSEAALAEAQQIAHIGSWVFDSESGGMQVSDEAFRIFDVEPRPVAPIKIFLDRIHEEDRAALEADIAAALRTGTLDVKVRIVTPDGTRVAHIVGRKRGAGEGRPGLIGTAQDITEQTAAVEALRQRSESLERSNSELERFNRLAVGRELRMIDLKQQVNDLCVQSGRPAPHVLPEEHAPAKETP
ncbi:MAG: PAS domain S-box protein [Thermoanaerobaculia bacterium]